LRDLSPTARSDTDAPGGVQLFLDQEITRIAKDYGPNEVVIRREIAPGQTVEFFVEMEGNNYRLVPLGDGDRAENATIIIEEYNPQVVDMVTITLDSPKAEQPFFMFKKKDGGTIAKDSLVSVTDIFGEYGSR
jgi:bifunctional DNA-binding transcriptional regulator/antitoxin component of YhaV-PrlF toxin-antitoxin module